METVALVIIAATLVMSFTDSAIAEKETGVIHVGGKVLCQDCTQGWNEWAHGGNPIKGTYVLRDWSGVVVISVIVPGHNFSCCNNVVEKSIHVSVS